VCSSDLVWNGSALEAYTLDNWATYAVMLTTPDAAGYCFLVVPATLPAGYYMLVLRRRIGATAAYTDDQIGTGDVTWSGTAILPPGGTATTGGNGASNQTSRDVISPLGNSTGFLVYDSVTVRYAATRRQIPAGGKIVFMGVGFEAVNRPGAKPTFFNRVQLMDLILTWFGVPTGIAEEPQAASSKPQAIATLVRGRLILPSAFFTLTSDFGLFDNTGRRVLQLRPGANDLSRLPAGVYFVRTMSERATTRVVKIR
jgi:hypothetical protein